MTARSDGGVMLRTALALALVTGRATRVTGIRENADSPGLLRRHLTVLDAAARLCGAEVEGDEMGATEVTFRPSDLQPGKLRVEMGTAKSVVPAAVTLLPALLNASAPSTLVLEGGTHVSGAPPVEFLSDAYAPFVERMGASVDVSVDAIGFAPAAGGRVRIDVEPGAPLQSVELLDRGAARERRATALVAHLSESVGEREVEAVTERFPLSLDDAEVRRVDGTPGPGTALVLTLRYEHVAAVFGQAGKPGVSAQHVGYDVARDGRKYVSARVPISRHLANALFVPFACAGGAIRTMRLSRHAEAVFDLVERFGAGRLVAGEAADGGVQVTALTG